MEIERGSTRSHCVGNFRDITYGMIMTCVVCGGTNGTVAGFTQSFWFSPITTLYTHIPFNLPPTLCNLSNLYCPYKYKQVIYHLCIFVCLCHVFLSRMWTETQDGET